MSDSNLTTAQQELLRNQPFDDNHPGPILRDFSLVLDYVGEKGIKVGDKAGLLPSAAIGVLDPRLSRPMNLKLKRPQLRSHPYLQGLHLLLRATTIGRIAGKGDKSLLVLHPETLQSWRELNQVEQYFALLEAWLLVSRPEMVSGHDGMTSLLDVLSIASGFLSKVEDPERQRMISSILQTEFLPNLYHAALADLFGLYALEHPLESGKMQIVAGRLTPFGSALFTLLGGWARKVEEDEEEADPTWPEFGQLQPLLQPWFPEYQKRLVAGAPPQLRKGVFVFKVSLGKVWRTIAIADDQTLAQLMGEMLDAFDFDFDHLYDFRYRDTFGREIEAGDPRSDSEIPAHTVAVGSLPLQPGQSMKATYDYGDNWQFTVKLERIDPPGSVKELPAVLESHGKAPQQYTNWEDEDEDEEADSE